MTRLLIAFPGNERFAARLAEAIPARLSSMTLRRFPDEETLVRLDEIAPGCDAILVCSLDRPDAKFLPLAFAAQTARELGARRVGLVAPYLGYMRQDARFAEGQAVSARLFAGHLSRAFDWLVTVDPHLHRVRKLDDIYPIPSRVVHASGAIAAWIAREIDSPVIVGPDSESAQWINDVAAIGGFPSAVWQKTRRGDNAVEISATSIPSTHTPVLVDDIISTGRTMAAAIAALRSNGTTASPACVGVHAVFAPDAEKLLRSAGAASIATTNTIAHASNVIDISGAVAGAVMAMLGSG